jgi:3,4-dihydroxy 2-butanone 4-phosphate synthase / GTP cyclohydrolase II
VTVEHAIDAIRRGDIVIVTDDDDRENEGDLIMNAANANPAKVAFFLRHTSGVLCTALTNQRANALRLPLMVHENQEAQKTAFTISVDLARDIATGISSTDRSKTIMALGDPQAEADDFVRPGHVFPLRARDGGVLKRAGHTEASVDLSRLAGVEPVGVLAEVVSPDKGTMARPQQLRELARKQRLPLISIASLVRYRLTTEQLVKQVASTRVPTYFGDFMCYAWESVLDGTTHIALVRGDVTGDEPVLVRVHSECLTGDVFGSQRCDCGNQLADAHRMIAEEERGVVLYLRGHEGRGIGLTHKLRSYELQDRGHDTVEANIALGLPVDSREYGIGAQILRQLGISRMRVMTNNPAKYTGLTGYGLEIVERVPLAPRVTTHNRRYLETKRERLGHWI